MPCIFTTQQILRWQSRENKEELNTRLRRVYFSILSWS